MVSYQYMKSSANSCNKAIVLAFTIYGITTIINSFFHNNFMTPQVSVVYGVLLGLVERIGRIDDTSMGKIEPDRVSTWHGWERRKAMRIL